MNRELLEPVAQQYREDGYTVIIQPRADQLPTNLSVCSIDLWATRGAENVVVAVRKNRLELSRDGTTTKLAELVNSQPNCRFDLVILEPTTELDEARFSATEPSDEQFAEMLNVAEELADKGYTTSALLAAWGGLEAAMRRVRDEGELYGRTTPMELINTLFQNDLIDREQYLRLRLFSRVRNQIVHGLVTTKVSVDDIRYLTSIARYLTQNVEAAA